MQIRILLVLAALGGIAFVIWLIVTIVRGFFNATKEVANNTIYVYGDWRTRRLERKKQAALQIQERKIEDFRNQHPVQIVGLPDIDLLKRISGLLDEFIASVKAHRPRVSSYDDRFRSVSFSYPFEFFFLRKNSDDDGPDPEAVSIKLDGLAIQGGRPLQSIYGGLAGASEFPVRVPSVTLDLRPPPQLPRVQLPKWSIKIIACDGREIDARSDTALEMYRPEFEQARRLKYAADELRDRIKQKWNEAKEELEVMDLFIANQKLQRRSILEQFQTSKKLYEDQAAKELAPIRNVHKCYLLGTKEGIEDHFSLGLETLALPLPPDYPWRVFYDSAEQIIQVNQRVPFLSDITVKRPDSNRAPAKRDADYFLRRLVPAISLHIAANVAINDLHSHANVIAVNCWSRFFERSTGKRKDAFISSLKAEKDAILGINVTKADPLDAFRALQGAFVYSTEEIVPVEPEIRLDKEDRRFVAGKEILEGMAQGQNLATMDWQEFEHLIRELLAKEYGKEGSDVRITRASRDKGVDAVVFDPDPLRGGKYVVQAKRYNNVVDVSAVRDLYGTMMNEGAARGILVTTSRYGRDAFDFASNKPITLIDGQNLLSLLTKHGYQFKIELN
jgi:Restriction endonuclease